MTKKMRTKVLRVNWVVIGSVVMLMAVGSLIFNRVAFAANPPPVSDNETKPVDFSSFQFQMEDGEGVCAEPTAMTLGRDFQEGEVAFSSVDTGAASDVASDEDLPTTRTDGEGRYRFVGLPHGSHRVTLDLATLPLDLQSSADEAAPVVWVTPGTAQTSSATATGVRFTVIYDRDSGDIHGAVFVDADGDGAFDAGERGLPDVLVIDPTAHQYFVPFNDASLWQLFSEKKDCQDSQDALPSGATLESSIFLVSSYDGTTYYYDHWEDGYDDDPFVTADSTEVGILDAGATKLFQSDIDIDNLGDDLDPDPDNVQYYYDGRDRITIFGEEVSVVRQVFPPTSSGGPGVVLAGAWELTEVADWGDTYVATVGEDLDTAGGTRDDHYFAGMEVMAALPGTEVYVNSAKVATLGAGGTYSVTQGVSSDDVITATGPIQVQLMTGGCERAYSARGYTLQPVNTWTNEYWAPVPSFPCSGYSIPGDPDTGTDGDTDIYIHNPNASTIVITATSDLFPPGTPLVVSLDPNQTKSLLDEAGSELAGDASGVHIISADPFWGLAVIDSSSLSSADSNSYDWGYSLVPVSQLSAQAVVGYAPGNNNSSPNNNGNLAFVTAITDTTVYVDLNQDGWPDPFDMNGNGDAVDNNVYSNSEWDEPLSALGISLGAGESLRVGDPNDRNLEGALIYTEDYRQKIAVAWGQDICWAQSGSPYLDLGYTVLPLPVPTLSKWDELAIDADNTGDVSPGDTITYVISLNNNGLGSLNDVVLTDTLPYTYSDFVTGSLSISTPPATDTIAYYDGAAWSTTPISNAQMFTITWPTIGPGQEATIAFKVDLHVDIPLTITEITNRAVVDAANIDDPRFSEDPDDPFDPDTDTPIGRPQLSIEKSASGNTVEPGDLITYTVTVTNFGTGIALNTAISDVLPQGLSYVTNSMQMRWPLPYKQVITRAVPQTIFFSGYYADDFDLDATQTTGYTGGDGSLDWSTDWIESNDDGSSTSGEIQAIANAANAASDPAYLEFTDSDGGTASLNRGLDLTEFSEPLLRFYVQGNGTLGNDDDYRVLLNGATNLDTNYSGGYTLVERDISSAAGAAATLGFAAEGGMDDGDVYRFDHVSVFERDPERTETGEVSWDQIVYTTTTSTNPISYDPATGQLVFTDTMRLPASGVVEITYQAQVTSPLTNGLSLTNTAYVTASNWSIITSPPTDTTSVNVNSSHTLALGKTGTPSSVGFGDLITYTLAYTASGNDPAPSSIITDALPTGTTFVAAAGGQSVEHPAVGDTGVVTWHLGTLLPAASGLTQQTGVVTLTVRVSTGASNPIENTARLSDDTGESDTSTTTTTNPIVDLSLSKTSQPAPAVPGEVITYTLVVANAGPSTISALTLIDDLPDAIQSPSYTPSEGSYDDTTGAWTSLTLGAGETITLTIEDTLSAAFTGTLQNTAIVTPNGATDPNTDDNDDDDSNPVSPEVDLALSKISEPAPAVPGAPITYTLVVTNAGPSTAFAITLTDDLPAEIQNPGYNPSVGSYESATGAWTDLTLGAGDTITLTIDGTLDAAFTGTLQNTAVITPTDATDPNTDDNEDDDSNTVSPEADLVLSKVASNAMPDVGGEIAFTIVVTNAGPSAATGVEVTDQLPGGYTYEAHEAAPGMYDNGTGVWAIGDLAADDTATLIITATVNASGAYTNTAEVTDVDQDDPTSTPGDGSGDDYDETTPMPNPVADLQVSKMASDAVPDAGDEISFTIVVTNAGPSDATGVEVTDQLASGYTYEAHQATPGTYNSGTGVWAIGDLAANDTATLIITATVEVSGAYTNTATASGDEDDSNPDNDSDTITPTPITDGVVTGVIYIDEDGDGVYNPAIDTPLPNVDVVITDTNGVTYTVTTDSSGQYTVTIPAGDATVDVDDDDLPEDAVLTTGSTDPTTVTVPVGGVATDDTGYVLLTPLLQASKQDTLVVDADSDGQVSPGDTLSYTVMITNSGGISATGVVFNDRPDPNTSLVPGSVQTSQGTIVQGNAAGDVEVEVDIGALAGNGTNVVITFQVTVDDPLPSGVTQIVNQGTVGSNELPNEPTDDPDTPVEDDPTDTELTATPDIVALKNDFLAVDADGDGAFSPGDTLLYEVTLINYGNIAATGVVFQDTPDMYTTLVTGSVQVDTPPFTVTQGNGSGDTSVAVDIGALPGDGGQVVISFRVIIDDVLPVGVQQIANQGWVSSNELPDVPTDDPDTLEEGDETKTCIKAAPVIQAYKRDTLLVDADGDGAPSPGDTLLYEVNIINTGNQPGLATYLTDFVDINTTLITGTVRTSQGAVTRGNAAGDVSVAVDIGEIPGNGGEVKVSFQVRINDPLPDDVTMVSNQGLIGGENFPIVRTDDPDTSDQGDRTDTQVVAAPELEATKRDVLYEDADGDDLPSPGDTLRYQITLLNQGNRAATNVVFSDTLDPNTTLVVGSVQSSRGTVMQGNTAGDEQVVIEIGRLPADGRAEITFQVQINDPLPAGVSRVANQGIVSSDETPDIPTDDPDTPEDGDETETPVGAEPIIEASKTDSLLVDADGDGRVSLGDTLAYEVILVNRGNAAALDVRFTDLLTDVSLSLVVGSVQSDLGTVATGNGPGDTTVVVDIGELPGDGGLAKITFQVQIADALPFGVAQVANQGVISGQNFDDEPTDDPDTPDEEDDDTETPVDTKLCITPADDYEDDDYYSAASTIPVDGQPFTRTFHIVNDKDWVKFYAWAERTYTVTTSHLDADLDTVLQLYDPTGVNLLWENDDYQATGDTDADEASRIVWTAQTAGWHYARVTHFDRTYNPLESDICGNHYLIDVTEGPCAVALDDYEDDDLYTEAAVIATDGRAITRSFQIVADKDWVRFEAVAGRPYTITTLNLGLAVDTVLQLYDTDGETLLLENDDYIKDSEASRIIWTPRNSGIYYARVTHFDSTYEPAYASVCGNGYQIMVETELCPLNDTYEPDSYYSQAVNVPASGKVFTRAFNTVADKDWVSFQAVAGQVYTITTVDIDHDVDTVLQLYDVDGETLLQRNDDYTATTSASRIIWRAPTTDNYYVRITHFDHTYDPRYALTCGGHYGISIEQDILGLTKFAEVDDPQLRPGDTIDYTIVVWNKLNTIQTNIVITDYVPMYTTYITGSARTNLGRLTGPDPLIVRVPILRAGGRITVTFQVAVTHEGQGQVIRNQAQAGSDQQAAQAYTPIVVTEAYYYVYLPLVVRNSGSGSR